MLRAVLMLVATKLLLKNVITAPKFNAHTRQSKKCQISATHISGTPPSGRFPETKKESSGLSEFEVLYCEAEPHGHALAEHVACDDCSSVASREWLCTSGATQSTSPPNPREDKNMCRCM